MLALELPPVNLNSAPGGRLDRHGCGAELPDAVVNGVRHVDVAAGVHRHAAGARIRGMSLPYAGCPVGPKASLAFLSRPWDNPQLQPLANHREGNSRTYGRRNDSLIVGPGM